MELTINSKTYGEVKFLIDDEDYDKIKNYTWHISKGILNYNFYIRHDIRKNGKLKSIIMHRLIMNCPDGMVIDHINGNTLDNRKCNLRICYQKDNTKNRIKRNTKTSSKYKGVSFRSDIKKYRVRIQLNKKLLTIGYFESEVEAAKKYNEYAKIHYGEFARLNIIQE